MNNQMENQNKSENIIAKKSYAFALKAIGVYKSLIINYTI